VEIVTNQAWCSSLWDSCNGCIYGSAGDGHFTGDVPGLSSNYGVKVIATIIYEPILIVHLLYPGDVV